MKTYDITKVTAKLKSSDNVGYSTEIKYITLLLVMIS